MHIALPSLLVHVMYIRPGKGSGSMELWDTTAVTIGMFNLEVFSSASHLPAPKYICNPCRYCPSPNWLLVALGRPDSSHPLPQN